MSKNFVKGLKELDNPQDMEDIQAMFAKMGQLFPNMVLYLASIGSDLENGATLISTSANAVDEDERVKKKGLKKGSCDSETLLMMMMTAMIRTVALNYKWSQQDTVNAIGMAMKGYEAVEPDPNADSTVWSGFDEYMDNDGKDIMRKAKLAKKFTDESKDFMRSLGKNL